MNGAPPLDVRVRSAIDAAIALLDHEHAGDLAPPEQMSEGLADATADLQAALRRSGEGDPVVAARLCRLLVELVRVQGELRERAVAQRFGTVARIHRGLSRLREAGTVAELLPAAAEELGRTCGLDRAAISRRRGSTWHVEAVWVGPATDADVARSTREFLTQRWIPLGPGTVESHLVQRRSAALVSAEDPGVDRALIDATAGGRYVASPVMSSDRVIGFLHGDRLGEGRTVTEIDRDNLWTFAEGFGLVFERLALRERLDARRTRVREAFAAAEQGLTALSDDELLLVSGDDAPPVPDPRAAGGTAADRVGGLLTARECEVVDLMATGARNREIAERLGIGEATVKSHVRTVGRKLEATSRADAVARYVRLSAEGAA
jgi:DNA-binding CsgD family transcriptional regulator